MFPQVAKFYLYNLYVSHFLGDETPFLNYFGVPPGFYSQLLIPQESGISINSMFSCSNDFPA